LRDTPRKATTAPSVEGRRRKHDGDFIMENATLFMIMGFLKMCLAICK
jgi:hypothetical protein